MSGRFDAIVIGAGAEGLAATALLAQAGLRALLLERSAILYGGTGEAALNALDPRVVKDLKLARHGLKYAARDVSLTVLGAGGAGAVLTRDRHVTAKALGVLSPADAAAFEGYRRELFALARALRPLWWEDKDAAETAAAIEPAQQRLFERLGATSADCHLASRFESEALRAALAFDAAAVGAAPSEAGSALALAWCAAQEMSGAQGAVAIPRGGASGLLRALSEAAQKAGAEIRTAANVTRLAILGGAVTGVQVGGETIEAPLVLSTLTRRRTLGELLPTGALGLGAAQALREPGERHGCATLVFGLNRLPDLGFLRGPTATRTIIAERPEIYETALTALRLGRAAEEPALELILAPPEPAAEQLASRLQLTVRAWPVDPLADDKVLETRVKALVERRAPGFGALVASADVLPPVIGPTSVARMLSAAGARITTPLRGLFLCGPEAEPAGVLCVRAARQAARLAVAQHKKARVS